MALIKCPECGKEISDKATACINCGCPLSAMIEKPIEIKTVTLEKDLISKQNFSSNSIHKHPKGKRKSICTVIIITLIIFIITMLCGLISVNKMPADINSQIKTIIDILSYDKEKVLSEFYYATEDGDKILIKGNFAELHGTYKLIANDDKITRVIFERDEEISDVDKLIKNISECLGNYDEYDSEWNKYEWRVDGLELTLYVEERIYFDSYVYDEANEHDEDNEIVTTQERAEANDYNEFKHAVDECIQYVPDCNLDLDYTDNDNSYSININDEIIGIFGTEIESWDAVALTDPDKDNALLHHKQISIALIMACDSDITYEDAEKIFNEADAEGSAMISTGKYFFEGVSNGMYAGGVDITWLGSSF